MLANILNLEGVQTLEKKILRQVNGGYHCGCGGGSNSPHGNEYGGAEGELCHEC